MIYLNHTIALPYATVTSKNDVRRIGLEGWKVERVPCSRIPLYRSFYSIVGVHFTKQLVRQEDLFSFFVLLKLGHVTYDVISDHVTNILMNF